MTHEELVTRTSRLITGDYGRDPVAVAKARQILAEVLRMLETEVAGTENGTPGAIEFRSDLARWLRASPLAPK